MANTVTTSIVVQFSTTEGEGVLLVEVDDRETADGGLNGGKTSFLPGDTVFLLMYKTSNVVIDAAVTSLGSLSPGTTITIAKTEDIIFANEQEASTRYPVVSGFTYEWIGADNGAVSLVGETSLRIPAPATGTYTAGVCRINYNTTAQVYTLAHSAETYPEYSIVVLFVGHTA